MVRTLLTLLSVLFLVACTPYNGKHVSLSQTKELSSAEKDSVKKVLDQMNDSCIEHLWDDDAFEYIDAYAQASREVNDTFNLGESYRQKVYIYCFVREDMDSAKIVLSEMEKVCKNYPQSIFKAKKFILYGYQELGQYNLAVNECQQILNTSKNLAEHILAYMALVELHNQTQTFDQALEYALKAAEISNSIEEGYYRHYDLAEIYVYVANMCISVEGEHVKDAIVYLNKADSIYATDSEKDQSLYNFRKTFLWYGYGQYYCKVKDYAQLLHYIKLLKEEGSEDSRRLMFALLNEYYEAKGDYVHALSMMDSLAQVKERMGSDGYNLSYWKDTGRYYEELGKPLSALNHYKHYIELQDSMYKERDRIQVNEFAQILHNEELRKERDLLDLEVSRKDRQLLQKKQQLLWAIIGFAAVAIAGLIVWMVRERRQRRKLECSHRDLQKAFADIEALSQMKTNFIRNMSHEIRTPLNQIIGFAQVVAMMVTDNEDLQECTSAMVAQSSNLLSIVNDTITLADIETKTLQRKPTSLCECCSKAIQESKYMQKEEVELIYQPSEPDVELDTDGQYLSYALRHLLLNAFKFTQQGFVQIDYYKDSRLHIHVVVKDTGCGIPVDKQEWVFGRFHKVDEFVPGAGLGLSVSREIVNRLGGTIAILPDYTDGCCVEIVF